MELERSVRDTHSVDDGVDAASGSPGGSQVGEVGIEDFGVLHFAECRFEFGFPAADYAKGNGPAFELGGDRTADGAAGAEDRDFIE